MIQTTQLLLFTCNYQYMCSEDEVRNNDPDPQLVLFACSYEYICSEDRVPTNDPDRPAIDIYCN